MTTPKLLALVAFLLPAAAQAGGCPQIQGKKGVLFGGDLSNTAAMQGCYPDFIAVSKYEGGAMIDCFAQQIDKSPAGGQKFIVAGHSTGSVHAEHLAQRVKDKSKERLVLLEGYGAAANQRGVQSICWYGKNGSKMGFNAGSMRNPEDCPSGNKSFEAPWCKTDICLHFSLVNLNVPADTTISTMGGKGYQNCKGNRVWIDQ